MRGWLGAGGGGGSQGSPTTGLPRKCDVDLVWAQFTYKDGDDYVFMDMETYEETRLPEVRACDGPALFQALQQEVQRRVRHRRCGGEAFISQRNWESVGMCIQNRPPQLDRSVWCRSLPTCSKG